MDKRTGTAFATALLAISSFVLALKLVQPASINVYLGSGQNSTFLTRVSGLYDYNDLLQVLAAAIVAGASGSFIILSRGEDVEPKLGEIVLNDRKASWIEVSKGLKNDETRVYQAILDAGGLMNQGELVEKAGLSKATVSRTLDLLESRGLVERCRRGMGNVILLK